MAGGNTSSIGQRCSSSKGCGEKDLGLLGKRRGSKTPQTAVTGGVYLPFPTSFFTHTRIWSCRFHFLLRSKAHKEIEMEFPPCPIPKANSLHFFSISPDSSCHFFYCS